MQKIPPQKETPIEQKFHIGEFVILGKKTKNRK